MTKLIHNESQRLDRALLGIKENYSLFDALIVSYPYQYFYNKKYKKIFKQARVNETILLSFAGKNINSCFIVIYEI